MFYFIGYIIGQLFVVVLSVYVCVSLCLSAIFARLSVLCHIVTCFFVVVVHFSLMATLFCFISLSTLLAFFFVIVLSVYVCVYLHLSVIFDFCEAFSIVLTCDNSLLFYFIRYIIGNFLCLY